jgi:hypothetical protein
MIHLGHATVSATYQQIGQPADCPVSQTTTYELPAPRGALSYPRFSREELGRRFLGLMAYSRSER